jgi:alcohol dehydrogenase
MDTYRFRKQIHKLPGKVIHRVPLPEPQVVEGHGARVKIGEICEESGYKKVLLVTDQILRKLGYEQKIVQSLEEVGVGCTLFANINSEPNIALIDEGRKTAMECQADCVIALGGGSVMDTCKMIAAGVKLPHLSTKTLLRKFLVVPGKTLPMITVPSTAGTGAEVTVGAVVTNARGTKGSTVIVGLDVTHVILDSELTVHAPQMVTAACGMDALSHVVEGTLSDVAVYVEDAYHSLEGVRLILQHLPVVMREPENIESRLAMCRAAMYGGNAINTQLAGYIHAFAHSIGAKYHVPHGQAITLMMLPVLQYQKAACLSKYAMMARYCQLADDHTDDRHAADKFLQAVSDLIVTCGLDKLQSPVQPADYEELTRMIAADSINYSAPMTFSEEDIVRVLEQLTVSS